MMLGLVDRIQRKKSRPSKSYGFISAYDGETYWFSLKGLEYLQVGDEVTFKGDFNDKGCVARYVKKVEEEDRP